MTDGRIYRFETGKQRALCLEMALPEKLVLAAESGTEIARVPLGAVSFAVSPEGELAWIDSPGAVRRDDKCAGPVVGRASRLLFENGRIWVLSGGSLQCIDAETLQVMGASDWPGALDIGSDGAGGVWLLIGSEIRRVDCEGNAHDRIDASGDSIAGAKTTLAVFSRSTNQITLIDGDTKLAISVNDVARQDFPDFAGERISSSGSGFVIEGQSRGSPGVLLLDRPGNPSGWGTWEDGARPLHVLASAQDLIIVVRDGQELKVLKLRGASEPGGRLVLTPPLESDTRPGDWLRANIKAVLPEGATLSLRWAATKEDWERDAAERIARDVTQTIAARVRQLQDLLQWGGATRTYVGRRHDGAATPEDFGFPLHEAVGHILWIQLRLHRSAESDPPELCSLVVHHDSPSLMERLPAVYRAPEGDDGGVLRQLVSVLETTTQDIDERIGKLAERLDPERTDKRWLPGLARLLGLPFDEALSERQQRDVLESAIPILAGRGTVRGVVSLLEALFKGQPYRVTDRTGQLVPITLGGARAAGSALPAFLAGPSERVPKLNARLVLGRTGLCKADPCSAVNVAEAPELLVEISASAWQQRRYAVAVRQMIEAILPAGVRLRLRWLPFASRERAGADVLSIIEEAVPLRLGAGGPLGRVQLGGDRFPKLLDGSPMERRLH